MSMLKMHENPITDMTIVYKKVGLKMQDTTTARQGNGRHYIDRQYNDEKPQVSNRETTKHKLEEESNISFQQMQH